MKKVIFLVFLFASFVYAKEPVTITLHSYKKEIVVTKEGKKVTKWVKPTKVIPGSVIKYVNTISNNTTKPLKTATVTNKIDKNLIFIPKSIESNLEYKVLFSINGKDFAPAKKLKIHKDGKEYLAKPKDYKAVRFTLFDVPAKSQSLISYQVKVK